MIEDVVILIPSYQPDEKLVALIGRLRESFSRVVIVDDGSTERTEIFPQIEGSVDVVLHHEVNRGKGAALKTGIAHIIKSYPDAAGVVTADSDGQHRVEDIVKVAEALRETPEGLVLGVRSFDGKVPFRSRFGNFWTRWFFFLIAHVMVRDTQTGLRGIPRSLLGRMLQLEGDRYEYEMRMLADCRHYAQRPVQVPIETIYIENNATSHFSPLKDTFRIYGALFKFCMTSVLSFIIDNALFAAVIWMMTNKKTPPAEDVFVSVCVSRFISANFNYLCNRFFVFHAKRGGHSFWKYWALVLVIAACSYVATYSLSQLAHINGVLVTAIKIVVDTVLFVLSYAIQKKFVFRNRKS